MLMDKLTACRSKHLACTVKNKLNDNYIQKLQKIQGKGLVVEAHVLLVLDLDELGGSGV